MYKKELVWYVIVFLKGIHTDVKKLEKVMEKKSKVCKRNRKRARVVKKDKNYR